MLRSARSPLVSASQHIDPVFHKKTAIPIRLKFLQTCPEDGGFLQIYYASDTEAASQSVNRVGAIRGWSPAGTSE